MSIADYTNFKTLRLSELVNKPKNELEQFAELLLKQGVRFNLDYLLTH
ncbi:hypothetical protein J3L11_18285 [Shewanella sp. 4t3-1-2LB]|nr:hypothetical protein [Shewanella sp. 4t3-1-2LB]MBO1273584.1 hypothetical protein [Shewanella sp. 4t3-1-2LB]